MFKMLVARRMLVVFAVVAVSSSVLPSASAGLLVDLRCSELQLGTYPNATTCGTSPDASPSPGQVYATPAFAGTLGGNSYSANASARSDYGTLGVAAYATATNTTIAAVGSEDTRTMQLLTSARSEWIDQFTIGGTAGTNVDIQVDMLIHIGDLYGDRNAGMLSTGYLTFNTSYAASNWCWGSGTTACGSAPPLVIGDNEISFVVSILAGTSSAWQSSFYAEAQVYEWGLGSGLVKIDAINTAHTFFTVLTPGASVSWTSGNDYSAPLANGVPEPATLALLGLGLAGLGFSRRKQ